jgi:hypothetical protein
MKKQVPVSIGGIPSPPKMPSSHPLITYIIHEKFVYISSEHCNTLQLIDTLNEINIKNIL